MSRERIGAPLGIAVVVCSLFVVAGVLSVTGLLHAEEPEQKEVAHKHKKAGETCYRCNPALREKGRMWCREHACYEDRCWLCHAELQDKKRPYCQEHRLYEDECSLCKPGAGKKESTAAKKPIATKKPTATKKPAAIKTCKSHGIAASACFICDASLRKKGRLWCREHYLYEDRCWTCHADLQDKKRPYCDEHGLYEDDCIFCKPEPAAAKITPTKEEGPEEQGGDVEQCKAHRIDKALSLIHISEPTRPILVSRMPSSA